MENIALLERIVSVIIAILVTNLWGTMEVEREWNKEYRLSFFLYFSGFHKVNSYA